MRKFSKRLYDTYVRETFSEWKLIRIISMITSALLLAFSIYFLVSINKSRNVQTVEVEPLPEVTQPSQPTIVVVPIVYVVHEEVEGTTSEITPEFSDAELDLLSHLIFAEAGSDKCSDKMQLYTGSVVLNRIKHKDYPDTMYDVIYDEGQYSCVNNGMINYEYNDRAYNHAKYLLENGSILPDNVVYHAQFEQGDGIYCIEQNMYFCYKGE